MRRITLSTSDWHVSGLMAHTFLDRLMGIRRAPAGSAVVIRARSVHGFWMRQPLQVVGLDSDMRVVATTTLRRNRFIVIPEARVIVEMPPGRPAPEKGDLVEVTGE